MYRIHYVEMENFKTFAKKYGLIWNIPPCLSAPTIRGKPALFRQFPFGAVITPGTLNRKILWTTNWTGLQSLLEMVCRPGYIPILPLAYTG
jgi:hypothetical protein